jgi:hypothetical protein
MTSDDVFDSFAVFTSPEFFFNRSHKLSVKALLQKKVSKFVASKFLLRKLTKVFKIVQSNLKKVVCKVQVKKQLSDFS